ncbi:hypothetical protein D3C86_2021860 [compost metagenome]
MEPLVAEAHSTGARLGESFALWDGLRAGLPAPEPGPVQPLDRAVEWLDARLKALQKELAQAGSHPQQLADLLG